MNHIRKFNEHIGIPPPVRRKITSGDMDPNGGDTSIEKTNQHRNRFEKQKEDTQINNNSNSMKKWLEDHPFDGVKDVRCSSKSVDIYFGQRHPDGYISLYDMDEHHYDKPGGFGKRYKLRSEESIKTNLYKTDFENLSKNKSEFISWVDKLLIKCGINRDVLKELEKMM